MTVDTKLFIDPLLMLMGGKRWVAAHDELIEHFVHCYRLVSRADSPTSASGKAAPSDATLISSPAARMGAGVSPLAGQSRSWSTCDQLRRSGTSLPGA